MRDIIKSSEPESLTEHRCQPHANYDNYSDKDGLRASLVNEQRGLCCYCLARIRPTSDRMKIEHWRSQSTFAAEQLDYSNLLGSCLGNVGRARAQQHCDTFKGHAFLSRNPANQNHQMESLIRFDGAGLVYSTDPALNRELNEVLNLNVAILKNNRKQILDLFKASLSRGSLTRSQIEKKLADWNGDSHAGELRPYCQVVVYWLRKRLRRGVT